MEAWPPLTPAAASDAAPQPPAPSPPAAGAWDVAVAEEFAEQTVSRLATSYANSSDVAVPSSLPLSSSRKAVVKFARETGDLQTLSDVDIKIIALAYMLEAEIHGTMPFAGAPPLRVVNVRNLQEAPLLGWGSNVPNLAEWEALDQMSEACGNLNSRIHPLNDLENQEIPTSETNSISETQGGAQHQHSKKDAGIAWEDDENNEGWLPAVSRSTHRRYLRRQPVICRNSILLIKRIIIRHICPSVLFSSISL